MTEKHTILQVFTQQNETTQKNSENPVTATVFNLTKLHENAPNLLAFWPLITRRSLVQVLLPQPNKSPRMA